MNPILFLLRTPRFLSHAFPTLVPVQVTSPTSAPTCSLCSRPAVRPERTSPPSACCSFPGKRPCPGHLHDLLPLPSEFRFTCHRLREALSSLCLRQHPFPSALRLTLLFLWVFSFRALPHSQKLYSTCVCLFQERCLDEDVRSVIRNFCVQRHEQHEAGAPPAYAKGRDEH